MPVEYGEQKNYWESIEGRRTPDHPVIKAFAEPKLRFIVDHLPSPQTGRFSLLDVGAGNGFFSLTFQAAFDVTAMDFSQNMLDMNPLPEDHKVQGDAEHLPFEDDSFDVVFCGNLLHHLVEPVIAVREMARVARGHVVLLELNALNPLMFLFGLLKKEERGTLKFVPSYLKDLGRDAGLRSRAFTSQGMVLPNKTPKTALPLFEAIDMQWPLGFYHVAIFDV